MVFEVFVDGSYKVLNITMIFFFNFSASHILLKSASKRSVIFIVQCYTL